MKLALIGSYGHVATALTSAAKQSDLTLAGVAKYDSSDRMSLVGKHPYVPAGTKVYDDYRKMLDEVRPDVVCVFMPFYQLAAGSIASAEHGAHVFSEKPLATTMQDLDRLKKTLAANNVRIAASLNMRGHEVFQAVRQTIEKGLIGRPILACGQKSYPFDKRDDYYKKRETYGGSIPWQAIHALDFVSYCVGRPYSRVAGMHGNAAHPTHSEMEDTGGLLLEFVGGGHAVISFDYLRPWGAAKGRRWGDDRLRIAGDKAAVEIVDDGKRVELMTNDGVQNVPLPPERDLFGEFVQSLRDGGKSAPLITHEESLRITEVALLARQAADEGRIIELPTT